MALQTHWRIAQPRSRAPAAARALGGRHHRGAGRGRGGRRRQAVGDGADAGRRAAAGGAGAAGGRAEAEARASRRQALAPRTSTSSRSASRPSSSRARSATKPRAPVAMDFAQAQAADRCQGRAREPRSPARKPRSPKKAGCAACSAMYQSRIEATPAREAELASLTRDYETLQQSYRSLLQKKEESQISANLERRQIGEQFKILDPARMPEKPASPDRPRLYLIVILAAIGIGRGVAPPLPSTSIGRCAPRPMCARPEPDGAGDGAVHARRRGLGPPSASATGHGRWARSPSLPCAPPWRGGCCDSHV